MIWLAGCGAVLCVVLLGGYLWLLWRARKTCPMLTEFGLMFPVVQLTLACISFMLALYCLRSTGVLRL